MLNPLSAATAIVLMLTVGAVALIARPVDEYAAPQPGIEAPQVAPVPFSATYGAGSMLRSETVDENPGFATRTTGGAWQWSILGEATDERLGGTLTMASNHDRYLGDALLGLRHSVIRIEDESGGWQSQPVLYEADPFTPAFPLVLIGEGAYDGQYVVGTLARDGSWTLDGHIFEGEILPAPEPYMAE